MMPKELNEKLNQLSQEIFILKKEKEYKDKQIYGEYNSYLKGYKISHTIKQTYIAKENNMIIVL